jgi:hypothetical protein
VIRLRRASGPSDADVARRLRTTAALQRGGLPPDLVEPTLHVVGTGVAAARREPGTTATAVVLA